jgi:malonyl-CoA/methylmalonyl-CoA synthetase
MDTSPNGNLAAQLAAAMTDPAAVAIEAPCRPDMSQAALQERTGRFANVLRQVGVLPGDRVVVQVEKSVEALILYLAVLRVGAVFVPLNPAYTAVEVGYFLNDARPRLFVCAPNRHDSLLSVAGETGARVETLGAAGDGSLIGLASGIGTSHDIHECSGVDLAAILYTSGTTGRSKGAMLSHDNLASNARALVSAWRFTSADLLIHALPIFHTHGLFVACHVALFSDARILFLPKFDVDAVLAAMPRATAFMGVPTFYTRLLADPGLNAGTARRMRLFISGSAPLLPEIHRAWQDRTGHPILERYGMTETGMNTSNPYDGPRLPGSVGLPLPGTEVRITDPGTDRVLATGETGMIEVRGPNVFTGYWRMPEKTKDEMRADGFFITGDLGRIDPAGYLHIEGRQKDLIITGGYNVYPREIETAIDAIPGVVESAVVGLPDADFGESIAAIVVAEPGAAINAETVRVALDGRLARFKQPRTVVFRADLPRNAMGKVQKQLLREDLMRSIS